MRFKPALLALALAGVFTATLSRAQTNPTGGVAVQGQASFSTPAANQLKVTTQNGAGTSHSAINWQSFSIAPGSSTNFQQPSAASTVVNRVVTNTPSSIFGTLSSNGKVVLVNQSGIAVGAGAVVDTAGFTASALRMTDADALAGRMRFGDALGSSSAISVEGRITARNGDVVLVAPNIDVGIKALIQAPNGSTLLAAGQQVEITGRGLEGITMLVQAPGDQVRNLGRLQGTAVGIFAGTLHHSGEIQATTASLDGGTVVLRASGDAYVLGAGKILATGTSGGQVDVLGNRVAVADQAVIDVSGTHGGGGIRVGGDYQGKNAQVQNAQMTYVGADTVLNANAVDSGAGGKVIVWADDVTRAYGTITANAGAAGGGGGFVETSGHRYLDVNGIRVTASGSATQPGNWLLDPSNVTITHAAAAGPLGNMTQQQFVFGSVTQNFFTPVDGAATSTLTDANLNQFINAGSNLNVTLTTTNPSISGGSSGDITFDGTSNGAIVIDRTNNANTNSNSLTLNADRNIVFASGSTTFQRSGASTGKSLTVELNPGTTAAGKVLTNSGASVVLNGVNDDLVVTVKNGKVWENSGTVTLNGQSLIVLPNQSTYATFANLTGGVLNVNSSNQWSFLSDSGTQGGIINNAGVLNVNGTFAGNSSSWEALYSNLAGGTLNIGAGKFLSMQNAGTLDGAVFVDAGGSLKLSEQHGGARTFSNTAFSGSGALTIGSGVTASFATTSGSVEQLTIDGTASVNGALSVKDYSQTLGGSSLGGSGALTITRGFTHTGGTFAPTGFVSITQASGNFSFNETVNVASLALSAPTGSLALNGSITEVSGLSLSANGSITQGAGSINAVGATTSATTVNAGASGNVTLTNPANNFSSIGVVGGVIQLRDANALVLNAVNAQTSLTVTTAGNVTQSAPIIVAGATTVNAGAGNVTMTTPGNILNSLSVSGGAINIVNGSSSNLAVNSLSSGSNQAVSLTSGAGLTLPVAPINTGTANLSLSSGTGLNVTNALNGNNISLTAANALTLNANIAATGTFTATTSGAAFTTAVNHSVTAGGAMNLNLAGGLTLQSGAGNDALLQAAGNQTIAAKYVELLAAAGDWAFITTTGGNQSITTSGKNAAGEGLVVKNSGTGTAVIDSGTGAQSITVNNADFVRVLGLAGHAALNSSGTQTIAIQGTGQNSLQVGSAAAADVSSINGINQTITAGQAGQLGNIELRGGLTDGKVSNLFSSSGTQAITTTGTLTLAGGTGSGVSGSPSDCGNVGACAIIDNSSASGQTITAAAISMQGGASGGYNIAAIQSLSGGSQAITVTGAGTSSLTGGSGSGVKNTASIYTNGAAQTISFSGAGNLQLTGGTNGSSNVAQVASNAAASVQTVAGATSISLTGGASGGGAGTGNWAQISSQGGQNISVGSGGLSLTGGGGLLTDNSATISQTGLSGTSQTITVNAGGSIVLQGGSSAQTNVGGSGHGSRARLESDGDSQQITFTSGGDVRVTGGTVGTGNAASILMRNGTQTISGATLVQLRGGASGGASNNENGAFIESELGNQNVSSQTITVQGGAGGSNNSAIIAVNSGGTGTQTITANSIALQGGGAGTNNAAAIVSDNGRDQTVNVGAGGLSLTGGGGGVTDLQNAAAIFQKTGTGTQTINVAGGGAITLLAGSGAGSNVGFDATNSLSNGSFASIVSRGAAQLINFTAASGSISATGGTVGSNNFASIEASNGTQTIRGTVVANAPTISLTGGATDGTLTEENGAFIRALASAQAISAGAVTLLGGGGVNNTSARIVAPTQNLTLAGALLLSGGVGGVRIGGIGGTGGVGGSNTDLHLNVTGALSLSGDSGGAAIGNSGGAAAGLSNTIDIVTTGDVALNPGTTGGTRIGARSGETRNGSISVAAGGNLTLNTGGGSGVAGIRSAGNVTLSASNAGKSITEASDSIIIAGALSASANSGISLDSQSNQVTSFSATNTTAGNILFTNTPGALLAVTGITQGGGNVRISADDLDISGAVSAGAGTVTLRPTSLARNIIIESSSSAGVMSLSPAELQQVTAAILDIGRLDGSGNININTFLGSGNVNGGTLRLLAGNNFNSSAGADIGSGATPFNHHLELRANNDAQLTNGNVFLADNRSLTVVADNDSSGLGNVNIGAVTLQVGSGVGNTTGNMSLAGKNITAAVSGGGSGLLRVLGSGTQTFTAANNIAFSNANAASGNLTISAAGGLQTVSAAGTFALAAGTGTGTSVFLNSGGNQTINAAGITVAAGASGGGSGTGNFAIVKSAGSQNITVGAGGLNLSGGGGALTDNTAQIFQAGTSGTSQTITVNAGGSIVLQGGSSAQTNVGGSGHGSRALLESDGDSQQITFAASGGINLTGGTNGSRAFAEIYAKNGSQTISGAPAISLAGGASGGFAGEGNTAGIYADGGRQTISASALALIGGATGIDNRAEIAGQLAQNIAVTNAPSVSILARAGKAGLFAAGNQTLSISGAASANALTIGDAATAEVSFVTGNNQQVTVGTGGQSGSITIHGGTAAGKNSGIFSNSGTQTVSTTGILSLTGGTAIGTASSCNPATGGSCADISNSGVGSLQTVSANTIQIQGGSGGVSNGAGIFVNGGPMQINAGAGGLQLIGGSGTSDNFASIGGSGSNGQTLTLNIAGNTTLDATNASTGSGAFIGLGGTGDLGTVTVNFNGTGNLTLTGSNVSPTQSGAAIGASTNQTNATATLNVGAADITFNPGSQSGVRFGHAAGSNGPGDIVVTASGNIALNANGSVGSGIRTTGNVTLHADNAGKSINEASITGIGANTLTVSANAGTNLPGANAVGTFNASSGGGNIAFSNTQSLSVGTISTPAGAQNVSLTAVGGGSALALGATTSDDNWTLISGGGTTLGAAFSANSLSLTSAAALTLSQDIGVTGNLSLITPNGSTITQSGGTITVGGQTTVNALSSDVTLTRVTNDFNQFGATGGIVRVRDVNGLVLNTVNAQSLEVQTGGSITLNGAITASAPGDAVKLAATAGTLDASAGSITTPSGRWLLYLAAPGANNFGSLTPDFKQYNATLVSTILGTGNGLLYGLSPTISAALGTGTPANKVYDATTGIDVSNAAYTVTAGGAQSGDTVTLSKVGSGVLGTKNVGAGKTVTVGVQIASATSGAAQVFGYTFLDTGNSASTASAAIGNVTAAHLAVSGISASNKVYDATTVDPLTGSASINALGSDNVTLGGTGTGTFANKNVGTAKPVTVSGFTLTGTDAGNYTLVQPSGLSADITAATISAITGITAANKVYDGNTGASLNTGAAGFTGRFGSDALTVASATGTFSDKNASLAKTVNITGLSLGGTDALNYTLANTTASTIADIAKANLVVSTAPVSREYDGTTAAAGSATASVGALFGGDTLSGGSFSFLDRNAGTGKTVKVGAVTVNDGNGGGNYTVSYANNTTSGITRRTLSTWTGNAHDSQWFNAGNWDALPDGNNVLAVYIPAGVGEVVFGNTVVNNLPTSTAGTAKIQTLTSASKVTQTVGSISSDLLTLDTKAGISLNSPDNKIVALKATNSGSGDIVIANTGALELQTMANTVGNITVTNTGAITTTGAITAPAGAVSITANSPLTVGTGGIAAGGDITLRAGNILSPGVTDNLTLNGPVSSQGKVSLSAGNNLFQNGATFGLNGVSATAGGSLLFGPLATANKTPVSYTINGVTVNPPPTEVGGGSQTSTQVNVLLTFLDQFEKAVSDRLGESPTNPDGSRKRKSGADLVTDAEVCK